MKLQIQSPLILFAFFLLVHFSGVHGRPIQAVHHHHHHLDHEVDDHNLINNIFFHQKDLKQGNSILLFFSIRNPNKTPKFLPKSVSDSLPFSLPHIHSILQTLQIIPNSPQAKSMVETLIHCQKPAVKGESKFCASSLESMLESVRAEFGSSPELLTTSSRAGFGGMQRFKVVEDPKVIEAPNAMACHPMPYPYVVFYCHGQKGSNRLYEMETETERNGQRVRVRMLGICHMDTSEWDPNHLAFKKLGIRPGQGPVCHAFPTDTLVWIPKQNSSSPLIKNVI